MKKWRCNVCGYIHEGDQPPESCPLCGVGPEEFSLVQDRSAPPVHKEDPAATRWKCTICDYIHTGPEPPSACPICGVGPELFVLLAGAAARLTQESIASATEDLVPAALDEISYGLYVVSTAHGGRMNGQAANSLIQLTVQPPQIAVCLNKRNLTHELIMASGVFAVTLLAQDQGELIRRFGYRSGRDTNKFVGLEWLPGRNGCPIVCDGVAYLEASVLAEKTVDVGTHTLFVARVTCGRVMDPRAALTYDYYRKSKQS